jgi:hypothetical protein
VSATTVPGRASSLRTIERESITPRIDSVARCRCGAHVIFDEVFGWLHAATGRSAAGILSDHVPGPAAGVGLAGWS